MLARLLELAARIAGARPGATLLAAAALTALAAVSVSGIRLDQDLTSLLPSDMPEIKGLDAVQRTIAGMDYAVAVIESETPDPGLLARAADRLTARLLEKPGVVRRVKSGIEGKEREFFADFCLKRAFLYLPEEGLEEAIAVLSPEGIAAAVAADAKLIDSPLPNAIQERIERDPLGIFEKVFLKHLAQGMSLFTVDLRTGKFISADGRAALIQAFGSQSPRDIGYTARFMDHLRESVSAMQKDLAGDSGTVRVHFTGGYPVAEASEAEIRKDMILSAVGSFVSVLVLFYLAFAAMRLHVIVGAPLAAGVLLTFGACAPLLGFRMTAVAAAFGSILIGLGIDYPIHLYSRFSEERRSGASVQEALGRAWRFTGPGVFTAGLTTVAAFAVLCLADFRGLVEVGTLVAAGVAIIGAVMLGILPALLALLEKGRPVPRGSSFGVPLVQALVSRRPGVVAAAMLALAAASAAVLAVSGLPEFDTDFGSLRSPMPAIDLANSVIEARFGISLNPILVVSRGKGRNEALTAAAEAHSVLAGAASSGTVLVGPGVYFPPASRAEKSARRLAEAVNPEAVASALRAELDANGFDPEAFAGTVETLKTSLEISIKGRADIGEIDSAGYGELLDSFVSGSGSEWSAVGALYMPGMPAQAARAAEAMRLEAALKAASDGDSVITGMDVIAPKIRDLVASEFSGLTGLSVLMVLVITFAHFRRPGKALLAVVPVTMGLLCTLGAMKAAGIHFNFMNVVAMPMIFGMGVDDGIHFMQRLSEKGSGGPASVLGSSGRAIFLTSLTTIAGFGSLVTAANPGLRSLGLVALIGISTCLCFSTLLLPALIICGRRLLGHGGGSAAGQ